VDESFSDAAPFSGREDSRREGLREKLLRSLESHRDRIAADVDERSAELTVRQAELEEEQARVAAAEAEVAERAARLAELGIADGEHAAVVDRLLTLLEKRDALIAELSAKEPEPEPTPEPVAAGHALPAPVEPPASAHLLFVPTGKRYVLEAMEGPAPSPGIEVTLEDGRRFRVTKLASSPLPADKRRCAYLEALV
jgi:multidrug efflux pump subunit AcrA (membrane-fusion protein)